MAFSGEESDGFLLGMSVQQCEIGVCQRTSEIVKEIFPGSKTITARVLSGITPAQRTKLLHVKEENGLPLQRLEGIMILKLEHFSQNIHLNFLPKPFDGETLTKRVREVLGVPPKPPKVRSISTGIKSSAESQR